MATLVEIGRKAFGEWLEQELDKKKISQVQLANAIDKSREQIRRLLRGETGTKSQTVIDIAMAIGEKPKDVLRIWYNLTDGEEDGSSVLTYKRTDDEEYLITSYRAIPVGSRPRAREIVDILSKMASASEETEKSEVKSNGVFFDFVAGAIVDADGKPVTDPEVIQTVEIMIGAFKASRNAQEVIDEQTNFEAARQKEKQEGLELLPTN